MEFGRSVGPFGPRGPRWKNILGGSPRVFPPNPIAEDVYIPRTHVTFVLIGKDHVLAPKQGSIRF